MVDFYYTSIFLPSHFLSYRFMPSPPFLLPYNHTNFFLIIYSYFLLILPNTPTTITLTYHTILHCPTLSSYQFMQKALDGAASAEGISKVDSELTALKHKVAGELTGAR